MGYPQPIRLLGRDPRGGFSDQSQIKLEHNLVPVEREIAEQINAHGKKQGVSVEKLVNFWLQEKLEGITTSQ